MVKYNDRTMFAYMNGGTMKYKLIAVSAFSCSIELINDTPYFNDFFYDVYLNHQLAIKDGKKNVFSLYDLVPGVVNKVRIIANCEKVDIDVKADSVSEIIVIKPSVYDDHQIIQNTINNLKDNGAIILEEGTFHLKPLILKSHMTIYLKKGANLVYSANRDDYPILDEYMDGINVGTWEGLPAKMYAGPFTLINVSDVKVVGEGIIDGNAQNGDWWIDHRTIRGATRPRNIYINHSNNILFQGITVCNSAAWTIHPFYSNDVQLIDLEVKAPSDSPNTDGCDPESSTNVSIIGCHFSVGDDCIAIKSGKKETAEKHYQPSSNITICDCLMQDGHGAIVLGSEMSSGIKNLNVSKCLFVNTDRGLRIKTRRGRGNKAIIDDVVFENIKMEKVLNPFVINMFYYCDADGKTDYVQNKNPLPIDEGTPYLGKFTFRNIDCKEAIVSAGFFYGLPEQKIKEIEFENVNIEMALSNITGYPAMMSDIEKVNRLGCYFQNVEKVVINNLNIANPIDKSIIINNVNEIVTKKNSHKGE